jgi:two-component system chemotaxis sensor kinase CheA
MSTSNREPILDVFLFETYQMLEQLEDCILECEKNRDIYSSIDEIFRIIHTIKGSSSMMFFDNIAKLTHKNEDLFYFIRENKIERLDYAGICDITFEVIDFVKVELGKIDSNAEPDGNPESTIAKIEKYHKNLLNEEKSDLKEVTVPVDENQKYYISSYDTAPASLGPTEKSYKYEAVIFFDEDAQMENVRAFTLIHNFKDQVISLETLPENPLADDSMTEYIQKNGFRLLFTSTVKPNLISTLFDDTLFVKDLKIEEVESSKSYATISKTSIDLDSPPIEEKTNEATTNSTNESSENVEKDASVEKDSSVNSNEPLETVKEDLTTEPLNNSSTPTSPQQVAEAPPNSPAAKDESPIATETKGASIISVNVEKLDQLMDIVGELVICESFVIQNPDLHGLVLENFEKSARQLKKITDELQDTVMSIRLVPIGATFKKMHRIVRDMNKKLNKNVEIKILGEDTEVDKNIIEHIADPLMHLIRNSLDHGIEDTNDRIAKGKPAKGTLTLEAKNLGGDVWLIIRDDGKGLDREKILEKAISLGFVDEHHANELPDKEVFALIFKPGFSTKDEVSEYSGRGVGMDVVTKNIKKIRGIISIDSTKDLGTTISIKIPLTLAIVDGMVIQVGNSTYTLPITTIKESFKVSNEHIIDYSDGKEVLLLRGKTLPILRLSQMFNVHTDVHEIKDGIILIIENEFESACIFADALIGEQQVVLKSLPSYIKKSPEIAGCTLLGNGQISLVLDVENILKH